jgi:hypothetical protein
VGFGDAYQPSKLWLPPPLAGTSGTHVGDHAYLHTIVPSIRTNLFVVAPFLSLFPDQLVDAPHAGETRPLADMKWVTVSKGRNAAADFHVYTEVPKATRVVGFVLNDLTAEFNAYSPIYGEKGSPGFLPISIRDWAGHEVAHVYSDEFGTYNALVPSTYTVNVPSPSGVAPNMLTIILNDPTMADPNDLTGRRRIPDPYYNPNFSTTPWTLHYYPGSVLYADTPIVPIAGFVGYPNKQVDVEPADHTPVIASVTNATAGIPGPYATSLTDVLVVTAKGPTAVPNPDTLFGASSVIVRDFGFGATTGQVTFEGIPLTVLSWSSGSISFRLPASFLTGADTLLYVEAVSNGTAKLTYGFTGTGEAEGLRCAAALGMTGYKIEFDLVSPALGVSTNPPPFAGMREQIFRPDQSPAPDQHAVVLYRDVIDANFNVQDFDVTLIARLNPSITTVAPSTVHWTKVSGPTSGELLASDTLSAIYRNPKMGGVYRFHVAIRNGTGTDIAFAEANLVLPLAGAEMDSVVQADLVKADLFATSVCARYSWFARNTRKNYMKWFYWGNAGDYVGRPDSEISPSVWYYGQVDTVNRMSDTYGLGAVSTWKGTPVRLAKISNFMVGYAARKIDASKVLTKAAGIKYGTINGSTGNESWDKGWELAGGGNYDIIANNLTLYIWSSEDQDDKTKKPWPNSNSPDNDGVSSILEGFDYDSQYASPGLSRMLTNP